MKRILKAATLAVASTLILTACGGDASTSNNEVTGTVTEHESFDSLHKAAQESGQTKVTGYVPSPGAWEPLIEAFNERYSDIEVEAVPLFGAELESRLSAEVVRGGIQADFTGVGEAELLGFSENGWLESFVPANAEELDPSLIGPEDHWTVPFLTVEGPIYNTKNLTEEDVPTSWASLVTEKYQDRLSSTPPTSAGGFPMLMAEAEQLEIIDEEWIRELKGVEPTFFKSSAETVQSVVSGQTDIYLQGPYTLYHQAVAKGAPLGFAPLEEGNVALPEPMALFKDSPSPDAAKLFASWLLTPEAQTVAMEESGRPGTMPESPQIEGLENLHIVRTETLTDHYLDFRERLTAILG